MSIRRPQVATLALAAAILFQTTPAFADTAAENPDPPQEADFEGTGASAREVYYPEDFARYAPRNAADMLEEIPGFTVNRGGGGGGGGGNRGFGQADENVLINGTRLSSKSTSTAEQLARIPVENVIRIEVVDGATLDIPGLSGRVANIIVEQGNLSGQFEWRPQFSTGPANPGWFEGEVSISGASGALDFTIALENSSFIRGSAGPAIFTDATGFVDERFNLTKADFNRPSLTGQFQFDLGPDVVANLNLTGGLQFFRSREEERRVDDNPLDPFHERFRATNDEWFYEIGADIEFPLGPGRLKLIGLESYEHGDFVTNSLLDLGVLPTSGSQFARLSDTGERIGRAEYRWGMLGADWQLSGEAAFNRLDQVGSLFGYDPLGDQYVEIPFPAGVGGVREDRYEALLSVGFPITENLSVQLIGGGEYSEISQTGANPNARSFQRPKGSMSVAWAPLEGLDINFEVARRVGQLDFGDFLASVNLTDDQANAGNNELRPQQSWEFELEIAKNFGRYGSATLTLFEERIEDLVLIVPVVGGGEARGNIASANRRGARFFGTLDMTPLGFAGAQLDLRMSIEDSNLVDPVTGVERRFDRNDPFEIRLDFRHDIPETDYAWGLEFRDTERAPSYRVAEIITDHSPSTFGAVFVEHKDVFGATVRLRVGNVFDANTTTLRTVYAGPRDVSPVLFTEDRRRSIGQVFNLTVAGSF
ncbi:TonB-dependent receptor plug domain-containing protein [Aurantiacibacter sp. MUD11]|uniref:TonB-dependent receptor plug domain-containing protein n=1 Tax=Aurantiacibacter sp. MUD11 TaxID=3003265 RepID=UPI0022AA7886|nr:TonB-dependent receptor [Aurantiacibacter sp. MUD11]WAT19142.1 TonB-dependent receptor plug domain-containing protein [Aurantiacibacter sp. MUD11]